MTRLLIITSELKGHRVGRQSASEARVQRAQGRATYGTAVVEPR